MMTDLEKLARACDEVDAIAEPPPPPEAAASNVVPIHSARLAEAKMLVNVAKPIAELAIPHLKGAPGEAWTALEEPIAELMQHYNVTAAQVLTNPWAKLALAAVPLTMHGYQNAIAAKKLQPGNADSASSAAIAAPEKPGDPQVLPAAVVLNRG